MVSDFRLGTQIGRYLGFGNDCFLWTVEQALRVREIIDEGRRQFMFPPQLPAEAEEMWKQADHG